MPANSDLKKLNKTIKIFAVAQFALIALLVFMAFSFQQKLQVLGRGDRFMNAVLAAFVLQLAVFYPIFKFASKEAFRDFSLLGRTLNQEEMKLFAKKKRWSDIVKMSVFGFYAIFMLASPPEPWILSVIFYSFILTILTYLQCYSFSIKKLRSEGADKA